MILVSGATGHLGTAVTNQLLTALQPNQFIVSSSNEEGVSALKNRGLQARLANFDKGDSLDTSFNGVTKLLIVSTMNPNRFEQHKNAIDAAKRWDVKQIIYTGLAIKNIQTSAVKDLMISHFQTEDYIKASGIAYTILRNTMYADALIQILGPDALNQNINLPGGNGKVPYALRREMGEATANLLLQEGHENKTYDFTGSNSYGYPDVAKALSELTGKTINYNDIPQQALVDTLKQIGFPDFLIYLHAGTIQDVKDSQYEISNKTLESLLGRPTASLKTFLKELFNIQNPLL